MCSFFEYILCALSLPRLLSLFKHCHPHIFLLLRKMFLKFLGDVVMHNSTLNENDVLQTFLKVAKHQQPQQPLLHARSRDEENLLPL